MNKTEIKNNMANQTAIHIMYQVMQNFSLTGTEAVRLFDKNNLWQIINDTDVLCLLAHDCSIENIIQMIGEIINEQRD